MFHRCALNGDAAFVDDIWSSVDRLSEAKDDVVLNLAGVEFMDSLGAEVTAS
jgi:anti-anti-sigma regulatory factor